MPSDRDKDVRDELSASLETRKELGPDFEKEIVDSFVEKVGTSIDARVDERLRKIPSRGATSGQRLALGIVSVAVATPVTAGLAVIAAIVGEEGAVGAMTPILVLTWVAVVAINLAFNLGGRRR